ncbi:gasdermin-C-like isoform X4 [Saccopteryx bilineata]|uniref:gasdermin-C-like isoform X4 n=1 Tax=Saccopteryx bilineata TaxID=59482 RepID=UPI00338FD98B
MPSMFERATKELVKEIGDEELRSVKCLLSATKIRRFTLVRRKKSRSLFWELPDIPLDISLLHILEPSSPVPDAAVKAPVLFSDTVVNKQQAGGSVDAGVDVSFSGEATQCQGSSFEYQIVSTPHETWTELQKRKLRDPEPSFLGQCRRAEMNLYVVTETVELLNSPELKDLSSGSILGKFCISLNIFVKGEGQGGGCKVREKKLTVPQGSVVAYKRKQLLVQGKRWGARFRSHGVRSGVLGSTSISRDSEALFTSQKMKSRQPFQMTMIQYSSKPMVQMREGIIRMSRHSAEKTWGHRLLRILRIRGRNMRKISSAGYRPNSLKNILPFRGQQAEECLSPSFQNLSFHPRERTPEPVCLGFKDLQKEVFMTMEGAQLSKDTQDTVFSNIRVMLGDREALQDLMDRLEEDSLGHLSGPGRTILNELQNDSRCHYIFSENLILYLLEAIMVLSDIQHGLLAYSMEKEILPQQRDLVRSILEPNFLCSGSVPFTLNSELLAPLQGESLSITYGLLAECGLKMELNSPMSAWEPEAKEPLCALYGALCILQHLAEASAPPGGQDWEFVL